MHRQERRNEGRSWTRRQRHDDSGVEGHDEAMVEHDTLDAVFWHIGFSASVSI